MREAVRAELTADGRTVARGAPGWILAADPAGVPLPGFRAVARVVTTAGAPGDRYGAVGRGLGREPVAD